MSQQHRGRAEKCAGRTTFIAILLFGGLIAWAICGWLRSGMVYAQVGTRLQVLSASFSDGGTIPARYACDGMNVSPELKWTAGPYGTRSFALIMDDPDAPVLFTHWTVYNIPPGTRRLGEGASGSAGLPAGATEGENGFGKPGYGGPCPPAGRPHHYYFHIFALDAHLELPAGAGRRDLDAAIQRHILSSGQIAGIYRRASR